MKAVFWPGIMFLTQVSRSRFKHSKISSLITHIFLVLVFKYYALYLEG